MRWLLLFAFLLAGCVNAELTNTSTTVNVIGAAEVQACRNLVQKATPDKPTETREEFCVTVEGSGISEQGAGVLNTLLFPLRYLGNLLVKIP